MDFSQYGNQVTLDAEELRAIIQGKIGFRKCPDCQGEGQSWTLHYTLVNDPDQGEQQKDVTPQFAADWDEDKLPSDYSWGECHLYDCETCGTVGYIPIEHL